MTSPRVALATAIAALCASLFGQTPSWSLGEGQAAVYDRTHEREVVALEPAPKPGDRPPTPGALPQPHAGGVLFRSDLDEKARSPVDTPRQLLAVLPRIAFDLRSFKRGRVRDELHLVHPFGTLHIDGEADRPDDSGRQELRIDIRRSAPPEKGEGAPRGGQVQAFRHGLVATLIVERRFDAEAGRIARFDAVLEGTLTLPENQPWSKVSFRIRETWRFREVVEADSPRLRERIGIAIRDGVEAVRSDVKDRLDRLSDNPPPEGEGHAVDHLAGEIALGLLTMVKGGTPKDDPLVQRAYDALRARELRDSYTLGVTLMAFEALYADPNERENLVEGRLDRPQPRTPSEADVALMGGWVGRLLANRDSRVDWSYTSRWTYTGGEAFDNSNTQYALLGLYSAQLCGVEVPTTVWWGAAKHFLDQQCPSEGQHALALVDQRSLRAGGTRRRTATRVDARGWSYTYASAPAYGSMTTAGIAGLTICLAGLRDAGVRGGAKVAEIHGSIRSGWAWLAKSFRVRENPGNPAQHAYWRYYYLYGLERACELSQVARLDEHDWYFEGATILLEMQASDGRFRNGGFVDLCFAVLFLKKASLPVFTGR